MNNWNPLNNKTIKTITTHIVPEGITNIRLQDYAKVVFKPFLFSGQGAKKAIKRGNVLVNGAVALTGYWIQPGDIIELRESAETPPKIFELPLEIIYEDEHLAVINKPSGIPVSGNQFKTIRNALLFNLERSKDEDALTWPKPVHRLDAPTSGLLLIARTNLASIALGQQFEAKSIQKKYHAIVIGKTPDHGHWDSPVNGQSAYTEYKTLESVPSLKNKWISLLELWPKTGRTHQIRIHLSEAGYPIMGDKIYGTEGKVMKGKGLFLASTGLMFRHPTFNKKMIIEIEIPYKFRSLLDREKRRWKKYDP
ncbi:MAG: RluA family pseudouridine synthase [Saprospiraceae bacterium]|nr:RluA family pseudouridine synthase [Saprospiraceae bacterium]MCB9326830.1 RluA family pseudouridine synthase [Lewinellaceae bacterium]